MERLSRGNLGYRKWRPPPRTGAAPPRAKRTEPNELEERLMRVLLEAAKPMPSAELGKQLGLFTNEVGSPARWLLEQQYIERSFRKIKIEFGGRPGKSRFAFWTLTDKGMAYLTGKDAKQEPASVPPGDQPAA